MADPTLATTLPVTGTTPSPSSPTAIGTDITGLIDFFNSLSGKTGGQQTAAAAAADPFASQRGQYQQQLLGLMKDPSSIFKDPAFTSSLNVGLEGVARTLGSQGMGQSGSQAAALEQYGQTSALNFFNQQADRLGVLSGATSGSPAAAGNILSQAPNATNAGTAAGIQAITGLLTAAGLTPSAIGSIISKITGSGGGIAANTGGAGLTPDQTNYTGSSSTAGGGDYYQTTDPNAPGYVDIGGSTAGGVTDLPVDTGIGNVPIDPNASIGDLTDVFASIGLG